MQLIVRPEAEQDLAEASDWYGERERGLRIKFVAKVEALLERIQEHPARFPHAGKFMRRASVRGFPYTVFYRIEARKIIIVAVFHHRRDLSALYGRLN